MSAHAPPAATRLFHPDSIRLDSPAFRRDVQLAQADLEKQHAAVKAFHKTIQELQAAYDKASSLEASFASSLDTFVAETLSYKKHTHGALEHTVGYQSAAKLTAFAELFRELSAHREVLSSNMNACLSSKMSQVDERLADLKDYQKAFDKSSHDYDVTRDKLLRVDAAASTSKHTQQLETEAETSKTRFDGNRMALVTALSDACLTAFGQTPLEAMVDTVGVLTRYHTKVLGVLGGLSSYVDECANHVDAVHEEYKTSMERLQDDMMLADSSDALSRSASMNFELVEPTTPGFSTAPSTPHAPAVSSPSFESGTQRGERVRMEVEARMMQTRASGVVTTTKEGYLLKKSTNSYRANDWKRRYFRLDSAGNLTYQGSHKANGKPEEQTTVLLLLSTIKLGIDDSSRNAEPHRRFVFRVVSPERTYTLQAENERDFSAWVDNINGTIATMLNLATSVVTSPTTNASGNAEDGRFLDDTGKHKHAGGADDRNNTVETDDAAAYAQTVSRLRSIPGNDVCADCGADEPVWASLNLGLLVCIECSGIHRQIGVHISKVRSLTLDTRVWSSKGTVHMFEHIGNSVSNALWEANATARDKPAPGAALAEKERFVRAKYVDHAYAAALPSPLSRFDDPLWTGVKDSKLDAVLHFVVARTSFGDAVDTAAAASLVRETNQRAVGGGDDSGDGDDDAACCSLTHLAACIDNPSSDAMLELLLQNGAPVDMADKPHLRTPLHYACIWQRDDAAKQLLARGGRELSAAKDKAGRTALDYAMMHGSITDEQLFVLLA